MQASLFDRYQEGKSILPQLDPRVKLVVTFGYILSNLLLPDGAWIAFGFSLLFMIVISMIAGLGWFFVVKRSLLALPFALAAVTIMFTLPGAPVTSFQLGPWHLTITDTGLMRFLSILVRSWLSVQAAIVLAATTQFPDLAHGLRHLRIPSVIVAIILFMYRYLFLLNEEAQRLLRARSARSASIPGRKGGNIFWRARVAGNMVGQLFVRSYERSDRIYNAMLARGYKGEFLTIMPHEMARRDWLVGAIAIVVLLVLQIIGRITII
jgi:cobalt/nickel transport system permease protein